MLFANASAKPAIAAVTPGAMRTVTAVTPTATEDRRLKRAESQRFTVLPPVSGLIPKRHLIGLPRPDKGQHICVRELHHVSERNRTWRDVSRRLDKQQWVGN
jgi:hypothetical protein